jgi:hypothetical protein
MSKQMEIIPLLSKGYPGDTILNLWFSIMYFGRDILIINKIVQSSGIDLTMNPRILVLLYIKYKGNDRMNVTTSPTNKFLITLEFFTRVFFDDDFAIYLGLKLHEYFSISWRIYEIFSR